MPAVSLTDFSKENLSQLMMGGLAVAGGFLAGYVLGGLAAYGFDHFVVKRASPHGLHRVIRYTCGLIVAIIIALLVFQSGRGPGLGGNGSGEDSNPGHTPATGIKPSTVAITTAATKPEAPPAKIQIVEAVKVRIFFGNDVEANTEKFFQVNDEPAKTDLAGLKAAVKQRKLAAKGQVVIVYEFAPSASERTYPWAVLNGAKDSLEAALLSPKQYQEMLAQHL